MNRQGRAHRPGRPTEADPALANRAVALRNEGLSHTEIGQRLGISRHQARHLLKVAARNLREGTRRRAGAAQFESAEGSSAPAAQEPTDAVSRITAGIDGIGRRLDRAEILLASAQARADRAAAADAALAQLDEQLARAQARLEQHAARLHRHDALQASIGEAIVRQTEALAETRRCLEHHNTLLQSAFDTLAMLPAKGAAA